MEKTAIIGMVMLALVLSVFYPPATAEAGSAGMAAAIIGGAILTTAAIVAANCAYGCASPYPRAVRVGPPCRVTVTAPAPYYVPRPAYRSYVGPRGRVVRVVRPFRPAW